MGYIGTAADGILEQDDPVTQIDGTKRGGENTDIGLATRHDERIDPLSRKNVVKLAGGPR